MPVTHDADYWIAKLGMSAHPEGGYYRESFRSPDEIQAAGLSPRYGSSRSCSTAIYFLLKGRDVSALHRIESDEVWHYYAGSPLTIHVIDASGGLTRLSLGPDIERGQSFQAVVRGRHWFGATVDDENGYSLVGCTVAPGFCFQDFELGRRSTLVARFPQHRELIERLTAAEA